MNKLPLGEVNKYFIWLKERKRLNRKTARVLFLWHVLLLEDDPINVMMPQHWFVALWLVWLAFRDCSTLLSGPQTGSAIAGVSSGVESYSLCPADTLDHQDFSWFSAWSVTCLGMKNGKQRYVCIWEFFIKLVKNRIKGYKFICLQNKLDSMHAFP